MPRQNSKVLEAPNAILSVEPKRKEHPAEGSLARRVSNKPKACSIDFAVLPTIDCVAPEPISHAKAARGP